MVGLSRGAVAPSSTLLGSNRQTVHQLDKVEAVEKSKLKEGVDLTDIPASTRDFTFRQVSGIYKYNDLGLSKIDGELNKTGLCPHRFHLSSAMEMVSRDRNLIEIPLERVHVDGKECRGDGKVVFVKGRNIELDQGFIENLSRQSDILVGISTKDSRCGAFKFPSTSLLLAVYSNRPIKLQQAKFEFPGNTRMLMYVVNDVLECVYAERSLRRGSQRFLMDDIPIVGPIPEPLIGKAPNRFGDVVFRPTEVPEETVDATESEEPTESGEAPYDFDMMSLEESFENMPAATKYKGLLGWSNF